MVTLNTFEIELTQFHLPNGRQEKIQTDISKDFEDAYNFMLSQNCKLEAEVLRTGEVSITITNSDEDLMIEVVPNGPEVQTAIKKLLKEFHLAKSPN